MLHLHDVMIGNMEEMILMSLMATMWRIKRITSSLCIKGIWIGRRGRRGESKSCKEEKEHVTTTTMPYHRPIHARIDEVHVYSIRAMGWRTHQFSWHRGDHAMHGVIGCVVCMFIVYLFYIYVFV